MVNKSQLLLPTEILELIVHIFDFGLQVLFVLTVTYSGYAYLDVRTFASRFGHDSLDFLLGLNVLFIVIRSNVNDQHVRVSAQRDLGYLDGVQ